MAGVSCTTVSGLETPPHILRMCDGFEVSRVDASADAAEVVEFIALGNGSDVHLVSEPMGTYERTALAVNETVPVECDGAGPQPALAAFISVPVDPVDVGQPVGHVPSERVAPSLPSSVVFPTPAETERRPLAHQTGGGLRPSTPAVVMGDAHARSCGGMRAPGNGTHHGGIV